MKKFVLLSLAMLACAPALRADEGMWLLPFIKNLNIKDMKAEGFRLSADDIYSVNKLALKDAVVIFGGGCTGEIVSPEGLLLTNHHCGHGTIQSHSSVEHDYLKNGFWAMSRSEEIPSPGLTVTFIRRIEDVSDRILPYLTPDMSEKRRYAVVDSLARRIIRQNTNSSSSVRPSIHPMFGGNQYIMFFREIFTDVRLVGAPPSSIGKFGGDTDNWMWPRHTGDFSVFRVYADPSGRPVDYCPENVPYKTPAHLKVSLRGMQPNDFAMIIGFPGSTQRYMTSWEIDRMLNVDNPVRIFVRGERQRLMKEDMMADDRVRIQYAAKYQQSSNYWKNSIGKSRGVVKLGVKGQKEALEEQFTAWAAADPGRKALYGQALPMIRQSVTSGLDARRGMYYINEALGRGVELVGMTRMARTVLAADTAALSQKGIERIKAAAPALYKDYNPPTDRRIAKRMVRIVIDSLGAGDRPSFVETIQGQFGGDVDAYVDYLFDYSVFASQEKFDAFFSGEPAREELSNDPGVVFSRSVTDKMLELMEGDSKYDAEFARGHREFIAGLQRMMPGHKFYPDANSTMRMTYGQVMPYRPADGVIYDYYTTLSGVMAKEDPANPFEFTVPQRLKDLYAAKDFGPYAWKGDVPTCFLSNNDITGGNSGSPVLNGRGELLGLAFDGNWEAMSGDIAFEPALQRTISVDIRYVLFIIDKYAGAGHLVKEMTIVK